MKFRQYHLCSVLKSFESHPLPLDVLLSRYFRSHKALGSKDRNFISETAYHYVRFKNLYTHLGKDPVDPELPFDDPTLPSHLRYGMPQILYDLLIQAYGETRTEEICRISNSRAPITLRANLLKTTRDQLLKRWEGKFNVSPCPEAPSGIQFHERINFFTLPEFKEGLFEIQDESSQLAAALVLAKPKDHVLDYCAGAGGKTLAFAHLLQNKGQIYLHDIRPSALQKARKRMERAGVQNVQFNLGKKGKMDWVVVDVPCTGTGTLRRNPDLKWKFNLPALSALIQEQRKIFQKALDYLRPDGTIVYMTCSILPQENEEQAAYFQTTFNLKPGSQFQTLSVAGGKDGFYTITFTKN